MVYMKQRNLRLGLILIVCSSFLVACRREAKDVRQSSVAAPGKPQVQPAQAAPKDSQDPLQRPVRGPVELKDQPPHVHGQVEAFPLVLSGPAVTQAVADRINAALQREQAIADAAAQQCARDYREEMHQAPSPDVWTRGVVVTFKGPRFLALNAVDSYFCGGAYPQESEEPLIYDLTTGSPVNWIRLFPAGARASRETAADGSAMGVVLWPLLARRAVHGATGECEGAYGSDVPIPFSIRLDARTNQLEADAYDVPHAMGNCEDVEVFKPDQLRKAGFAPELADALEAAHTLQH